MQTFSPGINAGGGREHICNTSIISAPFILNPVFMKGEKMTHVLGNCGSAEADVMTKLENYPSCVVKTAKTGPGAWLEDVCHSVPGCWGHVGVSCYWRS